MKLRSGSCAIQDPRAGHGRAAKEGAAGFRERNRHLSSMGFHSRIVYLKGLACLVGCRDLSGQMHGGSLAEKPVGRHLQSKDLWWPGPRQCAWNGRAEVKTRSQRGILKS